MGSFESKTVKEKESKEAMRLTEERRAAAEVSV